MNPNGNTTPLTEARRRISAEKRERALAAIAALEYDGYPVTHTAVARTASVSTWLTYTQGLREHIQAAQHRQATRAITHQPHAPSSAALTADLELAREEIKNLRIERDRLRAAIQRQLGHQLDTLSAHALTTRIDDLTRDNHRLADQIDHATTDNARLHAQVMTLENDLAAARTSLRNMIRSENRTH
ncbi:DUF6262 family protein [Streptomyces sp. LS1784]|uniref:DUF6262 family protein n=1 Tax=Streptomyces sp. LS1784 TaxID=2851533 RepID=UPI001CCD9CCB|nr:DUF6262 family protein [Streptomyces sp. LS1784]